MEAQEEIRSPKISNYEPYIIPTNNILEFNHGSGLNLLSVLTLNW